MRNRTFWDSVKTAAIGIITAFKVEKNYKYYFGIASFFMILNFWFNIELLGHLIFFMNVMGVFSAECFNTAIEHFIDMMDTTIRPEIKLIKDVAAGGVLFWGFAFFLCEFVVIGSKIL